MANHHRNKEGSETHEKTAVGRIRRRHGSRGAGDGDGPVLRTLLWAVLWSPMRASMLLWASGQRSLIPFDHVRMN
jgi:hypothetical protein